MVGYGILWVYFGTLLGFGRKGFLNNPGQHCFSKPGGLRRAVELQDVQGAVVKLENCSLAQHLMCDSFSTCSSPPWSVFAMLCTYLDAEKLRYSALQPVRTSIAASLVIVNIAVIRRGENCYDLGVRGPAAPCSTPTPTILQNSLPHNCRYATNTKSLSWHTFRFYWLLHAGQAHHKRKPSAWIRLVHLVACLLSRERFCGVVSIGRNCSQCTCSNSSRNGCTFTHTYEGSLSRGITQASKKSSRNYKKSDLEP